MKKLLFVLSLMLVSTAPLADNGVIKKQSANPVDVTIDKLETIVAGEHSCCYTR